jgi:hypothetical protein
MKKHLIIIVIFYHFLNSSAQENDLKNHKATVEFINADVEGTVTISSTGVGKKKFESIQDAARNAFFALLFRGIPGSNYKFPLIVNETEFKNHPVILEILNGGYVSFVSNATLKNESKKTKKEDGFKGIETTNNFTINYDALRRYLEQKKVIRKFGL